MIIIGAIENDIIYAILFNNLQVAKFVEDNKLEFLESSTVAAEETNKIVTPAEAQTKLLQLMNSDENFECIRGWVQVM